MKYLLCFTIESDIFILRRVFYQFNVRNNILYIYIVTSLFYNPFFSQVLYSVLKRKKTSLELLKIIRDFFKTIIFIGVLIYTHILNELSLSVNFVSLFFFGSCTILFILLFTNKDNSNYPLHTKVSAILLSPIIEELICREIAYNSDYILISYILGTIIFTFFHFAFDFKSIIYFLCVSSLLFLLREKSGAVLNSILLHMLMNLTIIYRK